MSKKFSIAKRISMEDIDHYEDIEVDDDFVDKDMALIISDNEFDPLYDDNERIAVALQLAGYGKISDLEVKLADTREECSQLFSDNVRASEEIAELKQQLAEKEKEMSEALTKQSIICLNSIENAYQDKISLAIEMLEKVSDWIIQHRVKPFFEERYIVYTKSLGSMIKEEIEKLKSIKEGK